MLPSHEPMWSEDRGEKSKWRIRRYHRLLLCVPFLVAFFICLDFLRPVPVGGRGVTTREVLNIPTDAWRPPEEWDPVNPIYNDFGSNAARFSSSTDRLHDDFDIDESRLSEGNLYNPYPAYSRKSKYGVSEHIVPCMGPRGKRLEESIEDGVSGQLGVPKDFPPPLLGSSRELGLDQDVCFNRLGRFSAYGLKNAHLHGRESKLVDWTQVNWGRLQKDCMALNSRRFDTLPRPAPGENTTKAFPGPTGKAAQKRVAVLFRSYDGMKYTSDMIRTMRAVIAELSLGSGGEYVVYLLVQVKDAKLPIFEDSQLYQKIIQEKVPKEFWDITVLWSEALWPKLYPFLPPNTMNVHISQWLPVQWFATKHSNFDHYWNWEMDIRYTGHYYDLVEALHAWTKRQPRKGLWERNARFWIPSMHGNYSEFSANLQGRYETNSWFKQLDDSIWGPQLSPGQERFGLNLNPPADRENAADDDFEWGVGEDADMITLLPMFNSDTTHYVFRDGYYNYLTAGRPTGPPRRTTIITFFRLSNRLLNTMHLENSRTPGHHMSSETWPMSVALQHGMKAVYAPHSIYMEKEWPPSAADFIFNNGDSDRIIQGFDSMAPQGEGSGGWESVFGLGREHNFDQSTWYYRTHLANRLYKRFLGYEVDGIGGQQWERTHGTYCLPPMLLHQIKALEDPVIEDETSKQAADRLAKAESEAKSKEQKLEHELNQVKPGPKVPEPDKARDEAER